MPVDDDDRPRRARRPRDDDDFDDRPRRRRSENDGFEGGAGLIVPLNVSPYSMAACYLGLIGMCLPGIGLLFCIPALICGILALRQRKKQSNYGTVTSDIRAWTGIVFSIIGIIISCVIVAIMITSK